MRCLCKTSLASCAAGRREDDALWATGAFAACTYPDLPAALTWRGLLNQAMGSSRVGQDPVPAHLRPGKAAAAARCSYSNAGQPRSDPQTQPAARSM